MSQQRLQFDVAQLKSKSNSVQLAKRVQALHEELASFEQEDVDQDSLQPAAKELISNALLLHKDRTVKAYVACCLADILKLLAPDAPYTEAELRDVFAFIFRQLKNLGKPNEAHSSQYAYLLDSLANAKSACLICELPGAEEQINDVFKDFFSVVGSNDLTANARGCMADILCQLLEEAQTVPQDAVDELLRRLLPKNAKNKTPSYFLAVTVFRHVAERLHRHVSAYFTDVFGQVQESMQEEGDADIEELTTSHELVKELNRVAPQVLLNVIPQLEEQLQSDYLTLRLAATKSLGSMFAEHAGMLDHLAKRYPSAWRSWLGRARDKDTSVRLVVIEHLKPIWSAHPALVQDDLQQVLAQKLLDPDEKVRCAAANVFTQLDLELVSHHIDVALLKKLAERIRDKKTSVAAEALHALAKLYNLAFAEMANGDTAAIQQFGWIPDTVFKSHLMPPPVANAVEAVVLEFILPLPNRTEDIALWVDRFIVVYSSLSETAQHSMLRMTNLAHIGEARPTPFKRFVTACEDFNGGIMDENEEIKTRQINAVIEFLGRTFPDPRRAKDDLHKFAKMNESRLYVLLKKLMDPQSDLKTILKIYPETLRRIETSASSILETFRTFVRRASLLLFNKTMVPILLKKTADSGSIDESAHVAGQTAAAILAHVAKKCPLVFKGFEVELLHALSEENHPDTVQAALLAASELKRVDALAFKEQPQFVERAYEIALEGQEEQPKFAASFIALHDPVKAKQLLKNLQDGVSAQGDARLVSSLKALNRLCRDLPQASEDFESLSSYILNDLLLSHAVTESPDLSADWTPDSDVEPWILSLVTGIKVLGNLCLAIADQHNAVEKAKPSLQLLWALLTQQPPHFPSAAVPRMKLQAALTLLKLSMREVYEGAVLDRIQVLVLTCQDPCFEVRQKLLRKLGAYLSSRRLKHPYFNLMLFIYAHDPEPENTDFVKAHVQGIFRSMPPQSRLVSFELLLIRLLHLLAHHPDFGREPEDLVDSAKYIEFYLDCVATADNISLLHYLCLKIRTVRDAVSQGHSENIYILSEIAQRLITAVAAKNHWIVQTYPGKIKLPSDIFKPLPSHQLQQDVRELVLYPRSAKAKADRTLVKLARKSWLSSQVLEEIVAATSVGKSSGKRKAMGINSGLKPKRKKKESLSDAESGDKSARKNNGTTKKRNKKAAQDDDAFGSESEAESDPQQGGRNQAATSTSKTKRPKPIPKAANARRSNRSTNHVNYASGQDSSEGEHEEERVQGSESEISSSGEEA